MPLPRRGPTPRGERRTLWLLVLATAACYGTGYPLALWGHSAAGWVLVFLGGPLLLILGVLTVRLLHRRADSPSSAHPAYPADRRPG